MKKKIGSIAGTALLLSAIVVATPAHAEYPPVPAPGSNDFYPSISGLNLIGGSVSTPIAIDSTPKSIPANSNVLTLSPSKKSATVKANKSTVIKFTSLPRSTYVDAIIKSSDGKSSAFLGAVKTDSKGNLQLPAFGLFKAGTYTLTVKAGKVTRTVKITVS
jgi:hypothetical protein